jgi:hypothetical protein
MTDDTRSGIALIVGSAGGLATMAVHPTGGGAANEAAYQHLVSISGIAHSMGIMSVAILFLGACGLTVRLLAADRLAFAALVAYGVAAIAALVAAAISGFIEPALMLRMVRDTAAAQPQWRIVIDSFFQINQTFGRMFAMAASVAVALWSLAALRNGGLGRGIATYGTLVGPLVIIGVSVGHLRMDVHGFGLIVLAQAIWFAGAGVQLCRGGAR